MKVKNIWKIQKYMIFLKKVSLTFDTKFIFLNDPYQEPNDDKKIIIYGHNVNTNELDFSNIVKYNDENFFLNNQIISIHTDEGKKDYTSIVSGETLWWCI